MVPLAGRIHLAGVQLRQKESSTVYTVLYNQVSITEEHVITRTTLTSSLKVVHGVLQVKYLALVPCGLSGSPVSPVVTAIGHLKFFLFLAHDDGPEGLGTQSCYCSSSSSLSWHPKKCLFGRVER